MGISVIAPVVGYGGPGSSSVVQAPNTRGADGSAIQSMLRSLEIPLPELYPIPDAHEFNVEADNGTLAVENNVIVGGAAGALNIDIPQGYRGVIRGVSIYITNMLASTNVVFSVIVKGPGTSPAGYQNLRMFPRVAPFVGNTFDSVIRVNGPATLQVIYSNLDGGSYQVGAALSGWYWNIASEERWKNMGA